MTRNRLKVLALVALLAVTAAGCGGGDTDANGGGQASTGPFTTDDLKNFIVKSSDLPSGYELQEDESGTRNGAECLPAETREAAEAASQLQSMGLVACQFAKFRKDVGGSYNTPGSTAFLFSDAEGASQALPVLRQFVAASGRATGGATAGPVEEIPVSGLGDEAAPGLRFTYGIDGADFVLVAYGWRVRNVLGFVVASDTLGDMSEQTVLDIAKKVDFRATS